MNLHFWFSILSVFAAVSEACKCRSREALINKLWESYKKMFSKTYGPEEEDGRMCNFHETAIRIIKHNWEAGLGEHTYTQGFNQFADYNKDEHCGCSMHRKDRQIHPKSTIYFKKSGIINLPENLDWRDRFMVTAVKDQGVCGSCWAFSAVGALESQILLKHGRYVDLSEQNLIDCSTPYGNAGCNGGSADQAFRYIIGNGGIENESSYPYKERDGKCQYEWYRAAATCRNYGRVPIDDEDALVEALATTGPISVGIHASLLSFDSYKRGIYQDTGCKVELADHAVLLVGYGTENGIDYWTIKNSYGPEWGDNGFIRIQRNMNNLCGIARDAYYPIL